MTEENESSSRAKTPIDVTFPDGLDHLAKTTSDFYLPPLFSGNPDQRNSQMIDWMKELTGVANETTSEKNPHILLRFATDNREEGDLYFYQTLAGNRMMSGTIDAFIDFLVIKPSRTPKEVIITRNK